ncbi:hypothetical protein HEK131_13160 [Streptomyces seoulensis]|nr:hypothetical protein HEK131_13160 [Streptomyces seoulensis]
MGGRAVHPPQRIVQAGYVRPIKVRNAHEMPMWWDAQVPTASRRTHGQAA